jgi:electron transfer flavoprotein alpha subunit
MLRLSSFAITLVLLGASMNSTPATAQAADPSAKVLRHIVMYKFKDTTTPAQVQEVVEAFAGLPKKVDTIIGYEAGTNVSQEGKSDGFTHVFVVTFKDEAGLATYLKHPAHDAYVQVVKDKREKVVVFDYWADK